MRQAINGDLFLQPVLEEDAGFPCRRLCKIGTIGIWLAIVGLPVVIVLTLIAFVLSRTRLLRRPVRAGPGSSDA